MARPHRATVEYFPHFCNSGTTKFVLQERFGNDGYAFWYRLLELLGRTDNHFYNFSKPQSWEFLLAETFVDSATANRILETLAELETIDAELFEKKIIWCQKFVDNLASLYARRKSPLPVRPDSQSNHTTTPIIIDDDTIPDPVFAGMIKVFEENIGVITPMMSDRIKVIQEEYPEGWFEKAVNEAVIHGKHNMKYIETILENWKANGITTTKQPAKDKSEKEYKF